MKSLNFGQTVFMQGQKIIDCLFIKTLPCKLMLQFAGEDL